MIEAATRHILEEISLGSSLTPEFRLLLDCSLYLPGSKESRHSSRVAALCAARGESAIDWELFLGLVDRHRVPSLVCAMLSRHAWTHVPGRIGEQIRERDKNSRMEANNHASELVRLGKVFNAKGIEWIPFKGSNLSLELYGDPCMRHSRDLDLLVKTEDLERSDRILRNEGYERISPDFDLTPRQQEALQSAAQHYGYRHPRRSVEVELHWRIDLWTPEQIVELWNCARPKTWLGAHFRQLSQESSLLLLCDHGSRHRWFRIKWLSDVAAILSRHSGMDWTHVVEMADRWDLRRSLAQAVLLVHRLCELPIEEPLWDLIKQEKKAIPMARHSSRIMLMREEEINNPSFRDKWRRESYYAALRARLPYQYFIQRRFVDLETWKSSPLPSWAFRLYYPLTMLTWLRLHYLQRLRRIGEL